MSQSLETLNVPRHEELQKSAVGQIVLGLALIVAFECLAFGISVRDVGIYMDEWIYFGNVHFAPDQSLLGLWSFLLSDDRIIIRPVEAFHFGTLFYFAGVKPLPYHLANLVFEAIAATFIFLSVRRFVDWRLALTSAILFIVYPSHDSTHYSIVASSLGLSMAFFTASIWSFIKAIQDRRRWLVALSAVLYALSLFNYELCLPLYACFPSLAYIMHRENKSRSEALRESFFAQLPLLAVVVSFVFYRGFLLPYLNIGWGYKSKFDLTHFVGTMIEGLNVTLSPYAFGFFFKMAFDYIKEGVPLYRALLLAFGVGALFFSLMRNSAVAIKRNDILLVAFGSSAILVGYTIYGLALDYKPLLADCINRINTNPSLGGALALAGILSLLAFHAVPAIGERISRIVFALLVSGVVAIMVLADWQFSKPWIQSWSAQRDIRSFIRTHQNEIKDGDSIILATFPRYFLWCPVLDGTWDYQNLVRITLNKPNVRATVISERLHISSDGLSDRVGAFECGSFPYERMFLHAPLHFAWQRISSEREFWQFINKYKIDIRQCKRSPTQVKQPLLKERTN